MASKVKYSAQFSAETGKAEANVKRYAEQIKAANTVLKQTELSAKQSYSEQRAQALATGASTEQLNKLTMKYNQTLFAIGASARQLGQTLQDVNKGALSGENAKAQAIELTNKELAAQIAFVNELAAANSKSSHETVSGVQATSAAIRGLEGSGGIRAVENFLSKTLGLGPAMQAIFPLVGGALFAQQLIELGEKIYEFRESGVNAGKALREGFEDLTISTHKHGVELDLVNDKLDTELAKLNHKPANLLKTALDEDRKAAYDLTEQLSQANKAENALLKDKAVSGLKSLGMSLLGYNIADTTDQQKLITQQNGDLRRVNRAGDDALDHADPKNAEATRQQDRINRQNAYTKAIQDTKKALDAVYANQRFGKGVDYSPQTSLLEGHLDELEGQLHNLNAGYDAGEKQRKVTRAEEAKQAASDAQSAARKVLEARKQAAEDQKKQWDDDFSAFQADGTRSNTQLMQFWVDRANEVGRGAANYSEAVRKSLDLEKKVNEDHQKLLAESIKMQQQFNEADHRRMSGVLSRSSDYDAKGVVDQQTSLKALLDAQRENTYQQALAQVQQEAALGTISKYDQAVQLQTLHTAEYAAQLKELQAQRNAISGQDNQSIARRNTLDKQIGDVTSRAAVESMKDSAAVAGETWYGALRNANARWIQDSQDSAKQVGELYSSVLNGVNGNLVDAMTGSKTHWKSTFQGIAKQTAGMGLQRAEGTIMGALGLGKADGSRGNPIWVRMADGSLVNTAAKSIGGGVGGMVSGIFGGFRAVGGPVEAGKTYIVGEQGPEPVTFGASGTMGTARDLSSRFGSTSHTVHVNVDARGATDPAAVEQAANRAVMAAVPHIMGATAKYISDNRARIPNSRA